MHIGDKRDLRAQRPTSDGGEFVTSETRDGRDLTDRSYFAIGVVLGMAVSVGLAMATILLVGLLTSSEDSSSSSESVAVASVAVETTPPPDAGGATDSGATSDGATDSADEVDDADLVTTGEGLATTSGCIACHSNNGVDGVGPTWSGLFGSDRPLVGGDSAIADDAYLLESLVNPGAQVVDGYPDGVMPATYGDSLSTEDIEALLAYIKSL